RNDENDAANAGYGYNEKVIIEKILFGSGGNTGRHFFYIMSIRSTRWAGLPLILVFSFIQLHWTKNIQAQT
ncbi:MAG: hypothetical protein ACXWV8_13960, partial [Chitinophagaceae bacterium]